MFSFKVFAKNENVYYVSDGGVTSVDPDSENEKVTAL